jgi:hypothetical protein
VFESDFESTDEEAAAAEEAADAAGQVAQSEEKEARKVV